MSLEDDLRDTTDFERLVRVMSCDSTQALSMADRGTSSAVFWADHQTAGRGRQGRSWDDIPTQDIAVTFKLADLVLQQPTDLAAAIPVAVVRALSDRVPDVRIKWPNDLLLDGRKLCGVLIDTEGQPPDTFHVGVGINVNRVSFPAELLDRSTSLALATGRETDRAPLLLRLARSVCEVTRELQCGADVSALATEFATCLDLVGQRVCGTTGDQTVHGILHTIDLREAVIGDRTIRLAHLGNLTAC